VVATPWMEDGDVIVSLGGTSYSAGTGSLAVNTMGPIVAGSDNLGTFRAYPIAYRAVAGPAANTRVVIAFICYSSGLVAFNLSLPDGASGPSASGTLMTMFPSFRSANALGEEVANRSLIGCQWSAPLTYLLGCILCCSWAGC
jgi:hypothetical protein